MMSSVWFNDQTDADGRYHLYGLVAGEKYNVELEDPDGFTAPDFSHRYGLGIQTVGADEEKITLPDVNVMGTTQSLRGVVIDRLGNPLEGFTIAVSTAKSPYRYLGNFNVQPLSAKTNDKGEFVLATLPDQPLELNAFRDKPSSAMARVRPAIGQQDVRIVIDSSLSRDVEDLDKPAQQGAPK